MDMVKRPNPSPQQRSAPLARKSRQKYYILAIIVLVIMCGLAYFLYSKSPVQKVDSSRYQVVYLSNGQAYFGKLQNTTGEYLMIKTPYTAQSVQSGDKAAATDNTTTLLKVSAQVYGPDDSIAIKSSQVLFWQNLRSDSKVSQAINAKQ
jgi:hypothetical protein